MLRVRNYENIQGIPNPHRRGFKANGSGRIPHLTGKGGTAAQWQTFPIPPPPPNYTKYPRRILFCFGSATCMTSIRIAHGVIIRHGMPSAVFALDTPTRVLAKSNCVLIAWASRWNIALFTQIVDAISAICFHFYILSIMFLNLALTPRHPRWQFGIVTNALCGETSILRWKCLVVATCSNIGLTLTLHFVEFVL